MLTRTRPAPTTGIVHLGLGAFFRAHGAVYLQEAMEGSGGDWGVVGVSLRSPRVRDQLVPQGYLYTAVELSEAGVKPQTVEVLTDVLVAPENPAAVLEAMSADAVKIVGLTVTEKGHCRDGAGGGLDAAHPDIQHDLTHPLPRTAIGFIVRALQMRSAAGLRPFTVLSLDNLPSNGRVTRRIVCDFARALDADLADWIEAEGRFPCTMVDRIVPATTPAALARLEAETGVHDPAAVFHEPFRQWVIEDSFVDGARPDLGAVGAQLVSDVEPFENMKLRMLNGTHSAMAYIGSLAGRVTVQDAISDPAIAAFLDAMWREEVIPTLEAPEGTDLMAYAAALKARYRNPEVRHLLEQIAMDGSQKLPQRILDPLFENLAAGRPTARLIQVLAAWIRFLQLRAESGINDPLAEELATAVQGAADDRQLVANVLAIAPVFGAYPAERIAGALAEALAAMPVQSVETKPKEALA